MKWTREIKMEDLLAAREKRAAVQNELLQTGGSLVCLTFNIPGNVKTNEIIDLAFRETVRRIDREIRTFAGGADKRIIRYQECGNEAFWHLPNADSSEIKKHFLQMEEEYPLGRLTDIDVLGSDGVPLSRTAFGKLPRRCLLCGEDARICARLRSHDVNDLRRKIGSILNRYLPESRSRFISECALKAMLYEVSITPKPGLVDRSDNGSHTDMDYYSFLDSAVALAPYFGKLYRIGWEQAAAPAEQLMSVFRSSGIQAEQQMLAVTGGVNTHKGLIYSLGIICGVLGWREANGFPDTPESLLTFCGTAVGGDKSDLPMSTTGGGRMLAALGYGGARQEAINGFPTLRKIAYPMLEKYLADGKGWDEAGRLTLLRILVEAGDSNLYARGGEVGLKTAKEDVRTLLAEADPSVADIEKLNEQWKLRRLSPGGSADILAMAIFLFLFWRENS